MRRSVRRSPMASTESPAASGWLGELRDELAALERRSLLRTVVTPQSGQAETLTIDGRELLNLTSNNYLGLANDPRVVEGAVAAARTYGASVSASRLLCGSTPLHEELEGRLAALKGQEAALLYSSGYLANLGVLTALAHPGDAIFSDALNHASIIDGCRLSGAATKVYRHCDPDHLAELLAATPARRRLIVSETVFSMDGDIAPLPCARRARPRPRRHPRARRGPRHRCARPRRRGRSRPLRPRSRRHRHRGHALEGARLGRRLRRRRARPSSTTS